MADLTVPELPEVPVSGNAHQPELPAPPLGGGRNGKRERETVTADLFGLEQAPPFVRDCKATAAPLVAWPSWPAIAATCGANCKPLEGKT